MSNLKKWINNQQLMVLASMIDESQEEADFFLDLRKELLKTIANMPVTYETAQTLDPIAHLHYFLGGWDWYITEKDALEDQKQAFGLVKCVRSQGELGYISIPELLAGGAELDYHFTKAPVSTFKGER